MATPIITLQLTLPQAFALLDLLSARGKTPSGRTMLEERVFTHLEALIEAETHRSDR